MIIFIVPMWFSCFVFVFFSCHFCNCDVLVSSFRFIKLGFLVAFPRLGSNYFVKRSVHQVSVHVMAAQSSNQLFYGVSASVAPDGSLVIEESAADRVQTQPVPMLLEDFLSDESSSEEGQAKSPTKIEKWKNKMISALTDALQKLEVDEKKNQIPRELNPVVDMVKDLLAKMTDGKAVERIEAYRVLEGARMSLEFDNLDLD